VLKRRFLDPLGIRAEDLAKGLAVPVPAVAELLSGARSLDADMALRLGLFFDVPARWWLEMQARHDAEDPVRLAELRAVVTPYPGLAGVLVTPGGVRHLVGAAPAAGPSRVQVSAAMLAQLRDQAERSPPRPKREPTIVVLDDGTPTLTGR
jgi:antitoxin HigA-1